MCARRVLRPAACACRDADEEGLEEEDDAELNAATFGSGAADDEDSLQWEHVAVASEAMKAGQPTFQPKDGPVFDAQLQHMLGASPSTGGDDAGEKRQWLPQGTARAESLAFRGREDAVERSSRQSRAVAYPHFCGVSTML